MPEVSLIKFKLCLNKNFGIKLCCYVSYAVPEFSFSMSGLSFVELSYVWVYPMYELCNIRIYDMQEMKYAASELCYA